MPRRAIEKTIEQARGAVNTIHGKIEAASEKLDALSRGLDAAKDKLAEAVATFEEISRSRRGVFDQLNTLRAELKELAQEAASK